MPRRPQSPHPCVLALRLRKTVFVAVLELLTKDQMIPWAWGMNGALSVLGATLAIFIAMNWGFRVTLLAASATYLVGLASFMSATARRA